ncbi:response regulator [Algoriphagus aquimarinus]|uniref:Response regulator transcription factor n=1 Tax=Algoriphagus aquimarinus TaxID=237018 RepID=A0A5C7ASY3_9BACT|nr:response regulator transcription factor [Algoriphagus aquimarinus]TXE11194.1 response regulator transcription factor [Algoriphagus aquimarinus]
MKKYQILLVDDHKILLEGTQSLLSGLENYEVAATASSGKEAIDLLKTKDFDILVTDYELPDFSGLEIIRLAHSINPDIKVIVLSMHDDPSVVKELLKENIDSFVLKNDAHSSLMRALDKVTSGKKYFSDEISEILVRQINSPTEKSDLSPRETEIIKLIARDFSTKQIAEVLFISEKTVETHRKNILRKTDCSSLVSLVNYAHAHNLA